MKPHQPGSTLSDTGTTATAHHKKFQYIPSLDNIRGYAVLFVLLIHASYGYMSGGWIGVELFFVLSGYLITSLLQIEYTNSGKISISRFYIRRVLRLYPALVLCVILANVLWHHNQPNYPQGNQFLASMASLFYFTNLIPRPSSGSLVQLWSLAVEEHFYLLWPLITSLFLFRLSRRNQVLFLVVFILLSSGARVLYGNSKIIFASSWMLIDPTRFTFFRVGAILFGALIAVVLSKPKPMKVRLSAKTTNYILAALALIFIPILFRFGTGRFYGKGGYFLIDLLCAITVFMAINNPVHYLLTNKTIKWLGTRSYGIYLYHYPIFAAFESFRQQNSISNLILLTLIRLVVSLAFAEASFRYLERPFLKLKKKMSPSGEM